ncbi:tail fiber assembly protein [Kosakonia sacchari]|uniref:tail fiber assembly protein n=1 Tax=Kosakonia sacchari TaxID=1158459 RepID=UPI0028ADBAD8|nr:tail fiber assembly protein [Kosakonia sacchari]
MTFDEYGFAEEDFTTTVYIVDDKNEYVGKTDTTISAGTGLPARAYLDAPPSAEPGKAIFRSDGKWITVNDYRGSVIYSTTTGQGEVFKSAGDIPAGFTLMKPATPFDKWFENSWVTDTAAQHLADVSNAELHAQQLIDAAMQSISIIQLKLQAGRALTDSEKARLNAVLDYIDEVSATDISAAPGITWPPLPV